MIEMQTAQRRNVAGRLVILLALAAAVSPAASLEHALDHLDDRIAEADVGAGNGFPTPDADPGPECDLCSFLANGRTAIAEEAIAPVGPVARAAVIAPAAPWLLPRSPRYTPESQRAPPPS